MFFCALFIGADVQQMQAVQQIMDNIYQYVNMPDMQQAERDGNIAQCLNTFFQGGAIGLYEGDGPGGMVT